MDTKKILFTDVCKFHLGEEADAWQAWFDDGDWESVRLPHDWSVTQPFAEDNSSGTGYLAGGIGWYRLRIRPDESYQGKRISIVFDGVYKNSAVWCNSYFLGKRPNGYISFSYDITEQFHFDRENVISVRVDHRDISDSRWFTGNGIYRNVYLQVEEPVHLTEGGVFFSAKVAEGACGMNAGTGLNGEMSHINAATGNIGTSMEGTIGLGECSEIHEHAVGAVVQNEIVNTLPEDVQVTVRNELLKPESGREGISTVRQTQELATVSEKMAAEEGHLQTQERSMAVASASQEIRAGEKVTLENALCIEDARLWSVEDPYLYTLRTTITYKTSAGEEITSVADERKVGLRDVRFDADQGMFLNGKPLKLKGVCVHHDAGCLGSAVYAPVWRRRLGKLKTMGCNAIRMSHNPHLPELFDLCDEMGFLVIDEAFDEWEGPKNKWWQGHNVYPPRHQGYYQEFPVWHEKDLTDLVRRDRNHPCVIMWSVGNEIDYPNDPYCHPSFTTMTGNNDANKPAAERQYNPDRPNMERLAVIARELCEIVKKSDTTRPVSLAAAFPELSAQIGFIDALDVVGYNYKEHLYPEHHAQFPDKPFLGSENGHDMAAWRAASDLPYIAGQFLWTGIDYLGEAYGWPIHGSGAGILTLAGFEKPGYYRRQSMFLEDADEKVVHLVTIPADAPEDEFAPATENWNYPEGTQVRVKCYTNAEQVELSLNGKPLMTLGKEHLSKARDCLETIITFEPGTLTARVVPTAGEANQETDAPPTHTLYTTDAACTYRVKDVADPIYTGGPILHQYEITMVDAKGRRVYTDSTMLQVNVSGGQLLGLENGDLADVTPYTSNCRRAYRGQLLAYVLETEGHTPTFSISGEGIVIA